MNFSNPEPIKSTQEKQNPIKAVFEKLWAGISMFSLMIPGATTKENISVKNTGVLIFILLFSYFGICGIYLNVKWLSGISVSGDWFYYTGISIIVFLCIDFFNMEKRVREFSLQKKIMYVNKKSTLEKIIGDNNKKLYTIFSAIMEAMGFFWIIAGIIFYDRTLFIILLVIGIMQSAVTAQLIKKTEHARTMFIIDSIFSILFLLFIINNHFFNII